MSNKCLNKLNINLLIIMESTVGQRVRDLRDSQKLTQTEFGAKIKNTFATISRIENGTVLPRNSTLLEMCRVFGVDKEWLINGVGEMSFPGKSEDAENPGNWKEEAYQLQEKYIKQLESQVEFLKGIVQKVVGTSPNFPNGIVSALGVFPVNTVSAA